MTELGYLQCFLTPALISTIANNTNLYAASKGAPAGWATSAEEVWLFIAVHIFMGIVDLPYLHMYWEEGWRQEFVVKAFSRHRFTELLRYFHIAEPTPRRRTTHRHPEDRSSLPPLSDHLLRVLHPTSGVRRRRDDGALQRQISLEDRHQR